MKWIVKLLKSKTIDFNAAVPAAAALCPTVGIDVAPGTWTAVLVVGNILLRLITTKSIAEK